MFKDSKAFSGFSVDDLAAAKRFYGETLGLGVGDVPGMDGLMTLHIPESQDVLVYAKPDHAPATFTVLTFPVDDIDAAVDGLVERGVRIERYEQFEADDKGIVRGGGPLVAWFRDPAGNVLGVMQEDPAEG